MRAASTKPITSGASVSSSLITSSLTHGVSKTSRAISAVVTASLTVWQPAVFGSTRTPRSRMRCQKLVPAPLPPDSRRSETVTISASEARIASAKIFGEGYCAVPTSSRDDNDMPQTCQQSSRASCKSATLFRHQDFDLVAFGELCFSAILAADEIAVARGGDNGVFVVEFGKQRGERVRPHLTRFAVHADQHP